MADNTQPPSSARRGLSDLQLSELVVQGLFDRYTHRIPLSTATDYDSAASVVILYGANGVGKTTILRMLDGLLQLDFDVFREVPFAECYLEFNTGQRLNVKRLKKGLKVDFDNLSVILTDILGDKGALEPNDQPKVEEFRNHFFKSVENISFNFIAADRAESFKVPTRSTSNLDYALPDYLVTASGNIRSRSPRRQRDLEPSTPIADEVKRFISEALVDSGPFFLTAGPDLFNRILDDLTHQGEDQRSVQDIRQMFEHVHKQDESLEHFGLHGDDWDYSRITTILQEPQAAQSAHTLTVLSTYANFLTSRAQTRSLIAERLLAFEQVMNEFLEDKRVRVHASSGLVITADGTSLGEHQLSSGERQLLYLMVAALTTRRKGTVIAIDEPELSMHIRWQKKLVGNLIYCASRAAPQFILATHSPEVATQYSEYMIELSMKPEPH
jgi:ABC-type cobalamin/Fe3+-siderophores transport system ATPase subunit